MDEKRFVKRLWMAKALLLAVLLYVGFEAVTNQLHLVAVLDPGTASGDPRAADRVPASPEARLPSDYTEIVRRNLFAEADGPENRPAVSRGSKTHDSMPSAEDLGLRLAGAIAGGPVASRAIIQNAKSNATGSYRIGDTVASATVEAIQRDAVILRYQGRPLVLKLHTGKAEDRGQKTEGGGQRTEDRSRPSSAVTLPSSKPSRADYVAEVFHKATIEPYVRNDRTEGLKITGLEKIPMAETFGLRNGDIVQTVNGQQLTSKQKAFQVLLKARTQAKVNIQVLRDGKSKDLSFNL